MTPAHIIIPDHLIGQEFSLPYHPATPTHAKEPEAEAIYRMLGLAQQVPAASVVLTRRTNAYAAHVMIGDEDTQSTYHCPERLLSPVRAAAIASWLEGHMLSQALDLVRVHGEKTLGLAKVLQSVLQGAQRQIVNTWTGRNDARPWYGLGIIPVSPDGEQFLFARKDHLHPCAMYCGRLSVIGGGMDLHEALSDWVENSFTSFAGMCREVFEEICDVGVAEEMCSALTGGEPTRVCCALYREDGQITEGSVRVFVARAPSAETWDRWRAAFMTTPGLSEAQPELVTRPDLERMIEEDSRAGAARIRFLMEADPAMMADREQSIVSIHSYEYCLGCIRAGGELLDEDEYLELADRGWKLSRQRAADLGVFPLGHRGEFHFISGHAAAIKRSLQASRII